MEFPLEGVVAWGSLWVLCLMDGLMDRWLHGYVTGACYFCLAQADQVDWVWPHEALIDY